MAELSPSVDERLVLPLLPLSTGVVLPQMVVTLALESDEARQAAAAAGEADGVVLLVPRVEGRYARVGTVARVESAGDLPNGVRALVLRGLTRAVVGVGVPGRGPALWVEAEQVAAAGEPTPPRAGTRRRVPGPRDRDRHPAAGRAPGRGPPRGDRPRRARGHGRLVA